MLGFDTERSARAGEVRAALSEHLPTVFPGYPTHFADGDDEGASAVPAHTDGSLAHRVEVTDLGTWFDRRLGFDPRAGVTTADWPAAPTQRPAENTGGRGVPRRAGQLAAVRDALAWPSRPTRPPARSTPARSGCCARTGSPARCASRTPSARESYVQDP